MTCVHVNRSKPKPMRDRRETSRAEARRRRTLAASDLTNKVRAVHEQVASTVNKNSTSSCRQNIQGSSSFAGCSHGTTTPRRLQATINTISWRQHKLGQRPSRRGCAPVCCCVDFYISTAVQSGTRKILGKGLPGIVLEMKDTFISLVTEGPFPCALSGFRGRRHRALYHVVKRRTPVACKPTNSRLPMQTN